MVVWKYVSLWFFGDGRYPRGESYLDVIQRLEPVVVEMERERESVCIVGHQAILRAIYGYFMRIPLKEIPSVEIPLHTLIEMTPMPDGTMSVEKLCVNIQTPPSSPPPVPPVRWFMSAPSHAPQPPAQVSSD